MTEACERRYRGVLSRAIALRKVIVRLEDALDRSAEEASNSKSERQPGVVLPGFDRIDRLTRHGELIGQLGLRPSPLCPKHAKPVLHERRVKYTSLYVKHTRLNAQYTCLPAATLPRSSPRCARFLPRRAMPLRAK